MILNKESSGSRWRTRPDGLDKVSGKLQYLTDMTVDGMLVGRVLRSHHTHARILSIRTWKALEIPGVHAVLTHEDVPGLNGFGIAHPHQPVFCSDRVRYTGDAIAAIAADNDEIAEYALSLIEVDYELLPLLDDPEEAMKMDAILLHAEGNVLHHTKYRKGEPEVVFKDCCHIAEETYWTPRQMHTYMETEGGLFIPEDNGRLTVYSATQHGLMDRIQLSRILDIPQEDIRVISSPIGGSFGGKDELNVQPYGALLALRTRRPVRLHNSRAESVRAGLKRHPMKITMRTGCDDEGKIIAHQVRIISDTGAYATLGAEVLNFATEHVMGPYRIDHVEVEGFAVYTNNGVSGEFRGFGGNQAIFALEGQIDRLAEQLQIDPWELRRRNLREYGDLGPLGQEIAQTDGAFQVWEALSNSKLMDADDSRLISKDQHMRNNEPWIVTGTGAAIAMHGAGLGYGIPDPAGGRLKLAIDGKIEAIFGYEEFGQGLIATMEQMLMEQYGFGADDIRIIIGDTDVVPDSGSSTASRATSMMWMALKRLHPEFTATLLEAAASLSNIGIEGLRIGPGGIWKLDEEVLVSYSELARGLTEPIVCETKFNYPTTPHPRVGAHFLYTYSAIAVRVEVNLLTGRVRITDQFHVVAAGPVANPQGYLGQIEGGSSMAVGFTLSEDAVMSEGNYLTKNLDTYLVPTIIDMNGKIEVQAIEDLPDHDTYGPRGIGEIGSVHLAPAVASAVFHAVGKRVSRLPIEPESLQETPFIPHKAVKIHAG
ncbi:xanthine dehydrogenase subunit D [Paenibacillus crassostreae]|uniref:Xanthine dehydrogenase subunit D n=1 Tax=Paenibacillus crassostreae TaxID=1763538 RepID=A0A162KPE8_9BACL|nr:xanthine dehydrogenase subunit D [Paenibacillus crassostreae]AOZ93166.1 xanthine dehydrogenase subunit D [Paenibacillus crassostreae]OAB71743.1 xanthine dehydrogenase subunit D [Paenibacillus crassostreae]